MTPRENDGVWRIVLCLLLAACRSPTEISVEIATDEACQATTGTVIAVGAPGGELSTNAAETTECLSAGGQSNPIGSIVLLPSGAKNDAVSIRVMVGVDVPVESCAVDAGGCIVARRRLRFVPHEPLHLPIAMRRACVGVVCDEDKTCVDGACYSATILDPGACATAGGCDESILLPDGGAGDATVADAATKDAATQDAAEDAGVSSSSGLLSLTVSTGTLSPAFSPAIARFSVVPSVLSLGVPLTVTPTFSAGAKVRVNGASVASGTASQIIAQGFVAPTPIDVTFTSIAGASTHYEIVVPPIQEAYAKASNNRQFAQFGYSLALSGDTLAAGSIAESSSATGINGDQSDTTAATSGAAYVFIRNGATWSQQAYVKASNTRVSSYFGNAIALSGDTLAVGAYGEIGGATGINGDQANTSANEAGAVYVYARTGTTWSQQAYVKASNTQPLAAFGYSVALSGDTLAVGAYLESSDATGINGNQADTSAAGAGAVYVFTRSGTTWSQQAYIKPSNARAGAQFGESIALSGDTLAVGSRYEASNAAGINGNQADTSSNHAGAAYVFTRSGTTWSQQAYVKASNTRSGAQFGDSVALSGDTLAVGASGESSAATGINGSQAASGLTYAGAVYVFARTGTTWTQQAYVKASNTRATALFGVSVALSGDGLAVGSPFESSSAMGLNGDQANASAAEAGAVYLFGRTGTTWSQRAYVKAANTRLDALFGSSVGISADTLAVGSPGESSNATGINGNPADTSLMTAGAVYILR